MIIAGLVFAWFQWIGGRRRSAPFQIGKITQITTAGKAERVAVSPDGKEVVYSMVDAGRQSLWLRQVNTGSEIRIVPPERVEYRGITFSRDGAFVYYVRREQDGSVGALYQLPKLGGAARRLFNNVDSPISLSPDGKQLTFVRQGSRSGENALMIANVDGAGERQLAVRQRPHLFRQNGPAWSPDGRLIASGVGNYPGSHQVIGVRVADGREESLTSQRWGSVGQLAWLPDGSGLIISAAELEGYWTQIWHLSYPSGAPHKVTRDLNNYANVSVTGDSRTIGATRGNSLVNIWIAPNGNASRAIQVTTGERREDGLRGLSWTPDDKIVYRSVAGGSPRIWIMEANGAGNRLLSVDTRQNFDPTVSPDGRHVVWSAIRTDLRSLWRMELD
ncbi:MAG: TolB family protein, partial [Blastocatellia bacterium]